MSLIGKTLKHVDSKTLTRNHSRWLRAETNKKLKEQEEQIRVEKRREELLEDVAFLSITFREDE
jgi:hypothetical protein